MDNRKELILDSIDLEGRIEKVEGEIAQVNMKASERHAKATKVLDELKKEDVAGQNELDALNGKLLPLRDSLKANMDALEKEGVSKKFFRGSSGSSISM